MTVSYTDSAQANILAYALVFGLAIYTIMSLAIPHNPLTFLLSKSVSAPNTTLAGFNRILFAGLFVAGWGLAVWADNTDARTNWRSRQALTYSGIISVGMLVFNTIRTAVQVKIQKALALSGKIELTDKPPALNIAAVAKTIRDGTIAEKGSSVYWSGLVVLATFLSVVLAHFVDLVPLVGQDVILNPGGNQNMSSIWEQKVDDDGNTTFAAIPGYLSLVTALLVGLMVSSKIFLVPLMKEPTNPIPVLDMRPTYTDGQNLSRFKYGFVFATPTDDKAVAQDDFLVSNYAVNVWELIAVHGFILVFQTVFFRSTSYGFLATALSCGPALLMAKRLGWGTWLEAFLWNQGLYYLIVHALMGNVYASIAYLGSSAIWDANLDGDSVSTKNMYSTLATVSSVAFASATWNIFANAFDAIERTKACAGCPKPKKEESEVY